MQNILKEGTYAQKKSITAFVAFSQWPVRSGRQESSEDKLF
jgi:hypothetical protein